MNKSFLLAFALSVLLSPAFAIGEEIHIHKEAHSPNYEDLTPEQQAILKNKHDEFKNLSPEERKEQRQQKRQDFQDITKSWDSLSPDQKANKLESLKNEDPGLYLRLKNREEKRQELMQLSPEERQKKISSLKEEQQERRQERKKHFDERWNNASQEQRDRFCSNASSRCSGGAERACAVVKEKCQ